MTPKNKAEELVNKFLVMIKYDTLYNLKWRDPFGDDDEHRRATKDAKMYAQFVADNVIEQENNWIREVGKGSSRFWKEVKKEIQEI